MFVGSAVSMVILQKVRNVDKTQNIELCNYTNLKKDARHFQKNEHVHSFENDVRPWRVDNASMLFNEAYQSWRVRRAWKSPSVAVALYVSTAILNCMHALPDARQLCGRSDVAERSSVQTH